MTKSEKVPKLRFREFSGEWQEKNLSGIVQFSRGGLLSKSDLNNDGKYKAIHYGQLFTEYGEIIRDIKSHTNVDSGKVSQVNDILMPTSDVTPQGLAKASVIHEEGVMLGGDINILQPVPGVFGDFLSYLLNSQKKKIMRLVTGTTVRHIYASDIKKAKYSIPDNKEQEKIAGFLGVVDEKIGQLQKKMELLVKYKKGVMQKIFSQQARFKDENGKNYPDWEEKKLEEAGKTYNGLQGKTAVDFGSGSNFITYKQIFDNSKIDISKFGKVLVGAKERQNQAEKGDAFFTTSSETPLEVGFASVLLDNVENVYLNSFCFGFRPNDQLLPEFARFLFRSSGFRKLMVRLAQGSTRYNISKLGFLKTPVLLPSKEEQQKIAKFLTALDDKIKLGESKLEQAKQFKKALLQQMFV